MARPIDRSDPAQATAVLTEILADPQQRDAILQAFAELADVAAGINPASWSITLKPGHIQLNVGSILVLRVSGSGLRFAGRAESTLPDEIRTHVEETSPFSIIPGVVIWKLPLAVAGNAVNVRWLTREARVVASGAASTRGPWRRAHSPGFVALLEQRLGRRLSWEPPSDKDPPANKDSPAEPGLLEAAIRHTRTQPYDRLARRTRAIDAARALIRGKLGLLDADDLRRLFGLFNQDFVDGRDKHNRFATGLVGNNANLLVAQLSAVNAALRELWTADDTWIAQKLTALRRGGTLPGGGWLFPTVILHTRDPERFLPLTDAVTEGLAALDGGPVVSLHTGLGYLEFCKRTLALLTAHAISPHYSDILLWYGQRTREPDADAEPDEPTPSRAAPTTPPPALPDPLLLVGTGRSQNLVPSAPPTGAAKRGSVGWLHLTDLHGLDIGVVGLNSSFLQLTGDDYTEKLDIHPRQLQVCGDYAPEWLQQHHINLLLTHHPPAWLDPRARQEFHHEIDSPGRFAAHFFGHMHEGTMTATRHGGGLARHTIQGSSLFGLEEHDGPQGRKMTRLHGYSAGRFEPTTASGPLDAVRVRIFPRKLVTGGSTRRIAPDHTEYDLDARNSFSFDVPTVKRA